eukprot:TRINITY_DN19146_c0_g1_i1.p1 TRINITY_DN19146_c0_g1~~TRINITY_DN19146_c0_g1_i1.p1  ORF type:complete len:118 (+),score=10.07 TRINITY_DN19146_c0_g1_i1:944-1297(+)
MSDIVNRGLARLNKASVATGEVGSARAPANLGCGRFGRARFASKRTGAVFYERGGGDLLSGGQLTGGGTVLQTSWARSALHLIDEVWSLRSGCGGGDRWIRTAEREDFDLGTTATMA